MTTCKPVDDNNATLILATLRTPAQGLLSAGSTAFLNHLSQHLSRACRLEVRNFIYSTQALVEHALVNKLRQPVVLFTTSGKVLQVNEAANRLFSSTCLVSARDGRLMMPESFRCSFLEQCA